MSMEHRLQTSTSIGWMTMAWRFKPPGLVPSRSRRCLFHNPKKWLQSWAVSPVQRQMLLWEFVRMIVSFSRFFSVKSACSFCNGLHMMPPSNRWGADPAAPSVWEWPGAELLHSLPHSWRTVWKCMRMIVFAVSLKQFLRFRTRSIRIKRKRTKNIFAFCSSAKLPSSTQLIL